MTRNSLENHTMHGDLHLHILTNQFSYWAQTKRLFKHREHACPELSNQIAGTLDKFRVIPRLVMLSYCWAFYASVEWFMALPTPTNSQAMFISTIVGAGAAFFGLYVGKPGASLPKGRKK